jgi:hypothetical protein
MFVFRFPVVRSEKRTVLLQPLRVVNVTKMGTRCLQVQMGHPGPSRSRFGNKAITCHRIKLNIRKPKKETNVRRGIE